MQQRIPFEAYSTTNNASLTYGLDQNPNFITVEGSDVIISYTGMQISPVVQVTCYYTPGSYTVRDSDIRPLTPCLKHHGRCRHEFANSQVSHAQGKKVLS